MFRFEPILKSVSRSFYLSVHILPKSIRPVIGLGYLLCRAADTMADTAALPHADRLRMLGRFRTALEEFPPSEPTLIALANDLNELLTTNQTPSEKALLRQLKEIIRLFHRLAPSDQARILPVVRAVIDGMTIDLETFPDAGETLSALKTESDLEKYLLLIGGEPGRFWSQVLRGLRPDKRSYWNDDWVEEGVRFGTGLQMVNILRDLPRDIKASRCYIPLERLARHGLTLNDLTEGTHPENLLTLYHELITEAAARLQSGLDYLERIPVTEWRLRAAVWWPCVLGLKTLGQLRLKRVVLDSGTVPKVSRGAVYAAMAASGPLLWSNRWTRRAFRKEAEKVLS